MPDLKVLDLTIGYPGVPRAGYAQEWSVQCDQMCLYGWTADDDRVVGMD
jgi:hypothetical protein